MKVVDDFLYPGLYDKILDSLSDLDYKLIDDYDGSKKLEADLKTEVVEEYRKQTRTQLELHCNSVWTIFMGSNTTHTCTSAVGHKLDGHLQQSWIPHDLHR